MAVLFFFIHLVYLDHFREYIFLYVFKFCQLRIEFNFLCFILKEIIVIML